MTRVDWIALYFEPALLALGIGALTLAVLAWAERKGSRAPRAAASPRWFSRLYAQCGGYFWLPCPVCGEMFGGHEVGAEVLDGDRPQDGFCVCAQESCAVTARRRNAERRGKS